MMANMRWITWATILGMTALITGCGGGDEPAATAKRESTAPAPAEPAVDDLAPEQPDEFEPPEMNIVHVAGTDEGAGSQIVQAAGESDQFDPAKIDGISIFDEDESEQEADAPEEKIVAPKEGTPEYYIHQIATLRLARPPQKLELEKLREWQKTRNLKIIENAEKAIALTHRDPEKVRLFDVAVGKLLETRLQLAVDGDAESVDALYEHAESLYKRDPASTAAAEGAFTLTQLAFSNSTAVIMKGTAAKDPRWLQEFARQAENYAMKFPKDSNRSIPLLFTAAERCEMNGLMEESVRAYTVIAQKFPQHPAAEVAVSVVRRLKMNGRRIKLYGTTLEGRNVSLEQHAGKPVVVYFWNSVADSAVKQMTEVNDAVKKYGNRIAVIGVSLDEKQETLEAFLAKEKLAWPNIFNADEEKRAWNNPIVKFYGVRRIPATWVIDAGGRVMTTSVAAGELDAALTKALNPRAASRARSSSRSQ